MATKLPSNLKYTAEHEWVDFKDGVAFIGITDFAQSSLGDVVYVEIPDTGKKISKDQPFGVVESIKSVSDLFAPISGEIIEKNSAVESSPELINEDCYHNWLIKIKPTNSSEMESLLTPEAYKKQIDGK